MTPRRLRIQIYADVLRAIHSTHRSGERVSLYRIECVAGLTHTRLQDLLGDLHRLGLLDGGLTITERGYAFLADVSGKVIPVLRKYELWDGNV